MSDPMQILVRLSRQYGADPEFVIAGGGNTSYKTEDSLFVKASGTELGSIEPGGFVELKRDGLRALLLRTLSEETNAREEEHKVALMASRAEPGRNQRPSVESLMHHVIPGRFVIHTHSTEMNKLTCCVRGESLARDLYGDQIVWIPFVDPGYVLSLTISEALTAWRRLTGKERPRAILMKNHGIIVSGDEPEAIIAETEWLLGKFKAHLAANALPEAEAPSPLPAATRKKIAEQVAPLLAEMLGEDGSPRTVKFKDDGPAGDFAAMSGCREIAAGGPLTPDQIVYCKSFPMWFKTDGTETETALRARLATAIAAHVRETRFAPKVILAAGAGIFSVGDNERGAKIIEMVYEDAVKIMLGARSLGGVQYLSQRDREFIDNWEVEQYRRKVSAAS